MGGYDDMAGLEFGEFDELLPLPMVKEMAIAGGSAAASILAATFATQKLASLEWFKALDPKMRARGMSGAVMVLGVAAGRALYYHNRDAAMGVAGGLVGLGLANLVGTFFDANPLGAPLGSLPEDMALAEDSSLLAAYDYSAMNGLAEAGVSTAAPAFQGLAGPTVTPEQLSGTIVQQETLGYAPYLS